MSATTQPRPRARKGDGRTEWSRLLLPVQGLHRGDVVPVQRDAGLVAAVEGGHEGIELVKCESQKMIKCGSIYLVRVRESKAVSKLMSSRLEQIGSLQAVDRPRLSVVKVCVPAIDGEIGMC